MSLQKSQKCLTALFVAAGFVIVNTATNILAQTSTATLSGTIEDQNRAVLTNVSVSIRDIDRNTERVTRTNDVGAFVMPALEPGKYSIAAVLPGFKKFVEDGIVLQV